MKLYNSLTKQKEDFAPITPGKASLYHCGPTVYDYVHIGNLRSFMLGDFLRRTLELNGLEVNQVMNITDVGHLVSDGDEGDDKMTKALKREGKEITVANMLKAATTYMDAFILDLDLLNIRTPHHIPRASDHIEGNIEMISTLETKGFVYTTSDGVYFDTAQMSDYGVLGGVNKGKSQDTESRTGRNEEKRQQADFALWKFDNKQGWDSPWGQGFPGWHIECSTMSRVFLGDHFDIHTGGLDNLPIHHNNEIAQSTCALETPFVNYWLHGAMLNFGGAKLSKSTGGNITLRTLKEKGFDPLAYRYMCLQTHYHSPMNFTWELLETAQKNLNKITKDLTRFHEEAGVNEGSVNGDFLVLFQEKVSDDLNFPQALAVFHTVLKSDLSAADKIATLCKFDEALGLNLVESVKGIIASKESDSKVPQEVTDLLTQRKDARQEKSWEQADALRDQIIALGYKVLDIDGEQKIEKAS